MASSKWNLLAITLTVVALASYGCGNSKAKASISNKTTSAIASTSTTSTPSVPTGPGLSRAQLVAKADPICRRLNDTLNAEKDAPKSKQDIVRVATRRAKLEEQTVAKLSRIVPVSSIAPQWEQIVATRQALVRELTSLARYAAVSNLPEQNVAIRTATELTRQMNQEALHMGFKDCPSIG